MQAKAKSTVTSSTAPSDSKTALANPSTTVSTMTESIRRITWLADCVFMCLFVCVALEETLFWYNGGSDEKSQNLMALKLEVLGPFLFSHNLLSDEVESIFSIWLNPMIYAIIQAKKIAVSKEFLPKDR